MPTNITPESPIEAEICRITEDTPGTSKSATISKVALRIAVLLSGSWEQIVDIATARENRKTRLSVPVELSFNGDSVSGRVGLSFSVRNKHEVEFTVEDPAQGRLPILEQQPAPRPRRPRAATATAPEPSRQSA